MAAKGITYAGGRIDAGYRGEVLVCLININQPVLQLRCVRNVLDYVIDVQLEWADCNIVIQKGDKIAQMSPFAAIADREVTEVEELSRSERESKGFGSSGR